MSLAAKDLENVRTALYAIQALAQVLGLDPAHECDRTALAALIEREASRASGIVDALINRESDLAISVFAPSESDPAQMMLSRP